MKKSSIFGVLALLFASTPALAQEAAHAASSGDGGMIALAAGLTIGLAAVGGAIGQGLIGSSAMEGIARNPQAQKAMFIPMIIGLALVESLVIYALLIAFQVVGKI